MASQTNSTRAWAAVPLGAGLSKRIVAKALAVGCGWCVAVGKGRVGVELSTAERAGDSQVAVAVGRARVGAGVAVGSGVGVRRTRVGGGAANPVSWADANVGMAWGGVVGSGAKVGGGTVVVGSGAASLVWIIWLDWAVGAAATADWMTTGMAVVLGGPTVGVKTGESLAAWLPKIAVKNALPRMIKKSSPSQRQCFFVASQ